MKTKFIFIILMLIYTYNSVAQEQHLKYCLKGEPCNIKTGKVQKQASSIGDFTINGDKIVIDGDVYVLADKQNGCFLYQGPTRSLEHKSNGDIVHITPTIITDQKLSNVQLYITIEHTKFTEDSYMTNERMHLMDIPSFNALYNQTTYTNNNVNFLENQINTSYNKNNSYTKKNNESRYGYIDCHLCLGSGICKTCNGSGLQQSMTADRIPCANCLRGENGIRTGKCHLCKGTGKVYGLK